MPSSMWKTPQRTKHVVHIFCERTAINSGARGRASGVELYSRALSNYQPEQLRVGEHCRWRVTLSRFFFACHHWAHAIVGPGHCNQPFSSTKSEHSEHLECPNIVLSRNSDLVAFAQTGPRAKNNLRVFGPNVATAVRIFGRLWISGVFFCEFLFVLFVEAVCCRS